jgi:hypothetical protein
MLERNKTKQATYQVLLLDNDADADVKVQEAEHVDFLEVKEHLRNGGSVFITSKDSQKLIKPKIPKTRRLYFPNRRNYGALRDLNGRKHLNRVTCIH